MIIFYMQYNSSTYTITTLLTCSWLIPLGKRRQYHGIRYHCFDLHLVSAHTFCIRFLLWKEHWMYKCITFLRRRHPLPFDTRRFLKREEILTHHISNSMLNLIHERNTQSEKNITPLQQQKRNEGRWITQRRKHFLHCIKKNWCNFAWSIIMPLNH